MLGKTNVKVKPKKRIIIDYVDYIESTGTQYIDTGFVPTIANNTKIKAKVAYTAPADGQLLAGFDYGSGFLFGYLNSNKKFMNYAGSASESNIISVANQFYEIEQTYKNGSQTLIIDGETALTNSYSFSKTPYALYLFARNQSSGATLLSNLKLCYLKIYDNDVLVRDFKPVKDGAGVYCLYDEIEKRYYYNQGTGSFTGGASI